MTAAVQLALKNAGQILCVSSALVRGFAGVLGGCAVLALVSGCGTLGSSASSSGSASSSFSSYLSCLRQHGVNIPTARPSGGPGGFGGFGGPGGFSGGGSSTFEQARQACASLRPSGGFGGGFGGGQFASAIQAFRSCMAAHGEPIPTTRPSVPPSPAPAPTGTPSADRFLNGLNPSDPNVAAAVQACQSKLPSFGSGGPVS
jgi:hypothetical protein